MTNKDSNMPTTLISVPSDLEASMIVSALAAQEIDATTTGSFTAGFRAEAPGEVEVLVREADLQRASEVLAELQPVTSKPVNEAVARPMALQPVVLLKLLFIAVILAALIGRFF